MGAWCRKKCFVFRLLRNTRLFIGQRLGRESLSVNLCDMTIFEIAWTIFPSYK